MQHFHCHFLVIRILVTGVLMSFIISHGLSGYYLLSQSADLVQFVDTTDEHEEEKEEKSVEKHPEFRVDFELYSIIQAGLRSLNQDLFLGDLHLGHITETPTPPPEDRIS